MIFDLAHVETGTRADRLAAANPHEVASVSAARRLVELVKAVCALFDGPGDSDWTDSPGLEARYEAQLGDDRRRRLASALVAGAFGVAVTLMLDLYNNRHFALAALPWRLAVALLCLAGAAGLLRCRAPWLESALFAVPSLAIMLLTEVLGELSNPHVADRYMMAAAMTLASALAIPPLRYSSAIALTLSASLIYPLVLLVVPIATPLRQNADLPIFAIAIFAFCLLSARRNEMSRRRTFVSAAREEARVSEMNVLNAELLRLSSTDPLTGLSNRRRLETEIDRLWRDRRVKSIGVALIDVDHFKSINDTAGHANGDICLKRIAKAVASVVREDIDCAARYGGEEFVTLVPSATEHDVRLLGLRLCHAVRELKMPHPGRPGHDVTISVGLAWRGSIREDAGSHAMMREADQSLYHAKSSGRNQVAFLGSPDVEPRPVPRESTGVRT